MKSSNDANPNVVNIQSHDAKKNQYPLLTAMDIALFHTSLKECEDYDTMKEKSHKHCTDNKTMLRYIDLKECM